MIRLILLTRHGCHLCDEMKAIVEQVGRTHSVVLDEIDITTDRVLERRFGTAIPVLMHGDRVIARSRTTQRELLELLRKNGL